MENTPEFIHERYRAYDIVQIQVEDKWIDFSTIKTAQEAVLAAQYAEKENYCVVKGLNHPIADRGEVIS